MVGQEIGPRRASRKGGDEGSGDMVLAWLSTLGKVASLLRGRPLGGPMARPGPACVPRPWVMAGPPCCPGSRPGLNSALSQAMFLHLALELSRIKWRGHLLLLCLQ